LKTYRSRVLAVTAAQARTMAAELSPARDGALLTVVGEADAARRALNGLCPIDVRQLEEFAYPWIQSGWVKAIPITTSGVSRSSQPRVLCELLPGGSPH